MRVECVQTCERARQRLGCGSVKVDQETLNDSMAREKQMDSSQECEWREEQEGVIKERVR